MAADEEDELKISLCVVVSQRAPDAPTVRPMKLTILKSPYPYFGGKSSIAKQVWDRFGEPDNYVEPFLGSAAMLLARPGQIKGLETVNDKDGFIANFWRAVKWQPEAVAEWADWPVNENDLHARHYWLTSQKDSMQTRLEGNPDWFDPKIAGWWVWGMACWIGGEFCSGSGPWEVVDGQLVHLGNAGRGVQRRRVHLGNGTGVNKKGDLIGYILALAERFKHVRVCCGDWSRICGPTPTFKQGTTAVFLDPPYSAEAQRDKVYSCDDMNIAHAVREWALGIGHRQDMRIALCGYEREHGNVMPLDWECVHWKNSSGYSFLGNGRGRSNRRQERIWFSPACLKPELGLFKP